MRARAFGVAALTWALAGCSVVVGDELDPLEVDRTSRRDVSIRLAEFVPHIDQPIIVEFFDPDPLRNFVQAAALVDPLSTPCVDLTFPLGATVGATQVDFYADLEADGLDPPVMGRGDHVWRETLDESGRVVFVHEFNFFDISGSRPDAAVGDLVIDITGAEAMNDTSAVLAMVQQVNLAPPGDDPENPPEPDLRPSVNAIYVSQVIDGNLGPRRAAPALEGPPRLRGVVDGGVTYTFELNLGGGAMRCRLERRAPDGGDFVLEATLDEFTCDGEAPLQVYEDCAR